jgi:methylthioribose-1-phosphate isomerase
MRSIDWVNGAVELIDQTRLPEEEVVLRITEVPTLIAAIRRLSVRGAPALGVAGAMGVALAVLTEPAAAHRLIAELRAARPTAINLARGVDRAASRLEEGPEAVLAEALSVRDEEISASRSMSVYGLALIDDLVGTGPIKAMTICNTGGLAAVERGTALGVIQALHEHGRLTEALTLETRPLLQGARLTTWELAGMGAPHRLIVDGAGPFLISRGEADIVLTGADRIAANGDVANKIGTFSLALAAHHSGVPFVVVAPESSIDMDTENGDLIEVEDRGSEEVIGIRGMRVAPKGTEAANPAFDITPHGLITALVTDRRIIRLDHQESLDSVPLGPRRVFGQANMENHNKKEKKA